MATTPVDYDLLISEVVNDIRLWSNETIPPNLEAFYVGLRAFLGRGADAVGGKGDNRHRYGYHRSRQWLLLSRYSVYHANDYSVTHALDKGGDERWICALDATPYKVETLIAMCKRLDAAVRAGLLPQVREWYGNIDGDEVVDGWDTVRNRAASSDSSHLWHLHISFYRSRANWDHSNLLAVLTGKADDMTPREYLDMRLNVPGFDPVSADGKTGGIRMEDYLGRVLTRLPADLRATQDAVRQVLTEVSDDESNPITLTDADMDLLAAKLADKFGELEASAQRASADVLDGP